MRKVVRSDSPQKYLKKIMCSFWPVLVYGTQFRLERNHSYIHNLLGKANVGLMESLSLSCPATSKVFRF